MVQNTEKRELATYYRQRGFSYSEISKIVGVSKGTLTNWFAKEQYSQTVKEDNVAKTARENSKRLQLLNKIKHKQRLVRYEEVERSAAIEYKNYRFDPLFTAGVMIYLISGDQRHTSRIRLSTSTLISHQIFHNFLEQFLGVERKDVRFWLLLSQHQDRAVCEREWIKALRLQPGQLYKSQVAASSGSALHSGVGNTIIDSALMKRKLMRWVELSTKELKRLKK